MVMIKFNKTLTTVQLVNHKCKIQLSPIYPIEYTKGKIAISYNFQRATCLAHPVKEFMHIMHPQLPVCKVLRVSNKVHKKNKKIKQ